LASRSGTQKEQINQKIEKKREIKFNEKLKERIE
jgi:hypothetical protein